MDNTWKQPFSYLLYFLRCNYRIVLAYLRLGKCVIIKGALVSVWVTMRTAEVTTTATIKTWSHTYTLQVTNIYVTRSNVKKLLYNMEMSLHAKFILATVAVVTSCSSVFFNPRNAMRKCSLWCHPVSIRPSHWWIVPTQLKKSSNFLSDPVAPSLVFWPHALIPNSKGIPSAWT